MSWFDILKDMREDLEQATRTVDTSNPAAIRDERLADEQAYAQANTPPPAMTVGSQVPGTMRRAGQYIADKTAPLSANVRQTLQQGTDAAVQTGKNILHDATTGVKGTASQIGRGWEKVRPANLPQTVAQGVGNVLPTPTNIASYHQSASPVKSKRGATRNVGESEEQFQERVSQMEGRNQPILNEEGANYQQWLREKGYADTAGKAKAKNFIRDWTGFGGTKKPTESQRREHLAEYEAHMQEQTKDPNWRMSRTQEVTDPATLESIDRRIGEVEDKFETRLRDASAEDRVDIQREKNNALAELNRKKITGTGLSTREEVEAERERLHPYEKAPPKEKEGKAPPKEEEGLSQNVKDQLSSAEQWDAGSWMGEVKDDGQTTFGNIMSDGSQESGAAKAAREAKEKKEAENAKKPKGKQTKLGRNLKGHWLPGYGGSKNVAAVTNLDRTKTVRQDLADKRKKEQEHLTGEQTTLDVK